MRRSNSASQRFGSNLRAQRQRANISQERLSVLAGVHRTAIGLYEGGEREPRLTSIVKLAAALECPPEQLLNGINWLVVDPGKREPLGAIMIDGRISP